MNSFQHSDLPEQPEPVSQDPAQDLDTLCERWVAWSRTRKLYGPKPPPSGTLGRFAGVSIRPLRSLRGDAVSSSQLSAFHFAFICQPDTLDRRVFEAYYVYRIKPVKAAASALGISVRHFYRLLEDFSRKVHAAGVAIEASSVQPQHDVDAK